MLYNLKYKKILTVTAHKARNVWSFKCLRFHLLVLHQRCVSHGNEFSTFLKDTKVSSIFTYNSNIKITK